MAKGSSRRSRRREAQRQAHERRQRRYLITAGVVALGVIVGVGLVWVFGRSSSQDVAAAEPLFQFDTEDYHSLAFDPTDPETIYFGHHGGLLVSQDGGRTWQQGSLSGVDAMQQAIPSGAAEADRHYVAGHEAFQVSNDGGLTWQAQPNDLPALDIHGFAASPSDPNRLYAFEASTTGFFTSADGGASWDTLSLPPGMESANLPMAVDYNDPLHLYAGVGDQVIESSDGGQTWQSLAGPGGTVLAIATDPRGPDQLLVGTSEGLWGRGAEGDWQKLLTSPDGAILAVALHPEQPNRIAVVDQAGNFYRSDDGGATWTGT